MIDIEKDWEEEGRQTLIMGFWWKVYWVIVAIWIVTATLWVFAVLRKSLEP